MTNAVQRMRLNEDQGISQEQLTDWVDEGSPGVTGGQDGSTLLLRGEIAKLIFEHNSQTTQSGAGYTIPGIPNGRERQALQQLDETVRKMAPEGEVSSINVQDGEGHSLVHLAAREGHADAMRVLANLGADVNAPNDQGWIPVLIAAQNGHVDAIRTLANLGANVNTSMNDGATPVFIAAFIGHAHAIRALAILGANVNTPLNNGATPHDVAVAGGHTEAAALLQRLAQRSTPPRLGD